MKVTVVMNFEPLHEPAGSMKWPQDDLMAAWHRGAGRDAFLMEVEKRCGEREDYWRATAVDNTPDKGWADL
eukprot:1590605-Heterocapsa_arctica.AAC.1